MLCSASSRGGQPLTDCCLLLPLRASAAKKDKEPTGAAKLAHFLQHRERIETERLLSVLNEQGIEMVIYCYDGFCVDCHHAAAVRSILADYNN